MKQIILIFLAIFFFQNINAQTYDLLGAEKSFTTIANETTLKSEKGTINMKIPDFKMEMDGKVNLMDGIYKDFITVVSETEVRIKFEKYRADIELDMDGDVTKQNERTPIEGKEATYIKVKEKWSLKNPKEFKAKHLEELNYITQNIPGYLVSLEAIFPKSVEIGDTWEAKDNELIPIVGTGNNVIGTATFTLVSVEEKDDDTIATIGVVTKYSYDDPEGNSVMELEGTIKRSIKNYNFYKLETSGTYEMSADAVESGMKIKILMKGDCETLLNRSYN